MTRVIGGFDVVLGDSGANDYAGSDAREVFYGLGGDDTLTNDTPLGESYLVGGRGDDSYVVSPNSFTIVHENGNDGDDEFIDSISVGAGDATVAFVDGRHLIFNYAQTGTAVLFVDWEQPANRIETFRLYDGVGLFGISFEEFRDQVTELNGFIGNVTFDDLGLVADLDSGIRTVIEAVSAGSLPGGVDEDGAATVGVLYEAALDRDGEVDFGGLNFWIDRREAGLSFRDMSQQFLESAEFERKFGPADALSDMAFVDLLYDNVLGRRGDDGGLEFWNARVSEPGADRAQVMLNFALSNENLGDTGFLDGLAEIAPGVWDFV
ncbi:MAG: DUF4214 domain-containing protein [Pseudomonadota bacterium]